MNLTETKILGPTSKTINTTKHNKKRNDTMLDYGSLSVQELEDVSQSALREIERRRNETELPKQIDRLAVLYHQAIGRVDGDPWVQPTGAHDSYRQGATVTHSDKVWQSTTPANVWEPGVSGWHEVTDDDPADWVQPTGEHDAYQTGDLVTFEGEVWESVLDGNIWSPTAYPQAWKRVEEPVEDEQEVEEPVEDELEVDEPVPDFVQPTGEHDAYNAGDRVTFEGATYESLIDANVWSPSAHPQGWKKVDEPIVDDDSGESEKGTQGSDTQDIDVVE